ncbi:arylsulfatase [Gimesia maris]|uniref:Arylsulfatase n=1 Tax=Gimesia maris TaxID=122 RepID=A0ABX5YT85_9PLAN|nr:arylsulfatase [Gimesia maris]EDL58874.1 probable arylsulfatase A [Gimesia maris DSM 8797]QEG18800.1 Arylsulfatase [Gimesia maris]QGQ28279.1 arylsulfatase [Gimesia maris]
MHRFLFALSLVLLSYLCHSHDVQAADQRPNILWIIAEDMGPELGCYGTPEVKTPTLDQLAEKGMLFQNAFTVTPVCSTSRSSFMTGMYAMAIDAQNHRSHREGTNPLPDGVRVITDWFRPAGYTTANIKNLTDDKKLAKFYKGTGKTDWNFTYPKGKQPFDLKDWNELKQHQPFYAQINFSETHRGGAWNTSHEHIGYQADPAKVEIPSYYPDHPVTRGVWSQYLNAVMAVDKKVAFILDLLKRDKLDKNTIVVFLGDHGRAMPRGKQWPYDSGLHIPLIIYWPEGNANLPAPAQYQRGQKSEQLISSIDLSATSLAVAGISKPEKMQGQVFLGAQAEPPREYLFGGRDRGDETVFHIRTVRDKQYRYLRNKYPERPFLQINRYKEKSYPIIGLLRDLHSRGALTGPSLKLMADSRPEEELYDLKQDPWETSNLADSPDYQKVKQRLASALNTWMEEIDDQGRIPEDPSIPQYWDERAIRVYSDNLKNRPQDWFLRDAALGPYKVESKKDE